MMMMKAERRLCNGALLGWEEVSQNAGQIIQQGIVDNLKDPKIKMIFSEALKESMGTNDLAGNSHTRLRELGGV